ncbi:MAG: TolC family protein [Bacteriovoracaceae bacterium]|nr:TolC family protein [Bacteriovoracaceae bacterium]
MKLFSALFIFFLFFNFNTKGSEIKISFNEIAEKLSSNKEVKANELKIQSAEKNIDVSKSLYYPTFNLVGSVGKVDTLLQDNSGRAGYIQGSWNLYRGGRDSTLIDQSQKNFEITNVSNQIRFQEIFLDAKVVFADLVKIINIETFFQKELEYNSRHKQMAAKKVSVGLTGRVDILEFEVREDFIAAELRTLKSEKDQIQQKLNSLFGQGDSDIVIPVGEINHYKIEKNFQDSEMTTTLLYKRLLYQKEKTELERKTIRSEFIPRLDLEATYGKMTYQNFSEDLGYEKNVALTLTIPLFSGLSTVSSSSAKSLEITSLESNLTQVALNLRAEIKALEIQYQEYEDLRKINERRLQRAEQYYELTLAEYKRGIKNSPDLLASTERLFEYKRFNAELINKLQITYFKHHKITSK